MGNLKSIDFERCTSGIELEGWVCDLLRKLSFPADRVGKNDSGVDIIARATWNGKVHRFYIQCKYYNKPVGKTPVHEVFAGTAFHKDYGRPVVIVNNTMTYEARRYAKELGVEIIAEPEWAEFKVGDLFEFTRGKRVNKSVIQENPGKIPIISGGDESNGVMGYISEELANTLRVMESCITVSSYGSSGSVHYQGKKCCVHDNALALNIKSKSHDNEYTNLFLVAILQKLKENYAYGRPVIADRYKEEVISLPITADGKPDYDFMEQYMKSLPFSKVLG